MHNGQREWVLSQVRPYDPEGGNTPLPRVLLVNPSKEALLATLRALVESGGENYDEAKLRPHERRPDEYVYKPNQSAGPLGQYGLIRANS